MLQGKNSVKFIKLGLDGTNVNIFQTPIQNLNKHLIKI